MYDVYDLPEAVIDGAWPDTDEHPLRQLRAQCHRCLRGHTSVGEPFRFANEHIRINDQIHTTYERWMSMSIRQQRVNLFCQNCEKVTTQMPKGSVVVDG